METAYVTGMGQLVIPAKIRKKYGIKPGTKVCFIEREGEWLFQPVTKKYIRSMCGMLTSKNPVLKKLLEEQARDKAREDAKLERLDAR